jgi:hypothetical protein
LEPRRNANSASPMLSEKEDRADQNKALAQSIRRMR